MTPAQPVLPTTRLVLRPFAADDAALVQTLAGAREIADTTLSIPHPYPEGAAAAWIATHRPAWEAGAGVSYAITLKDTGALVGAIGLVIDRPNASAELGYWIAVPYWNRGYCTEAASAVVTFALDTLRVRRVQARHLTRNPPSGRVMQKIGMRLEGIQRDAVRKWGRLEDTAIYAIAAAPSSASSALSSSASSGS